MNKTQFTNRWSNMNLTQHELDRKWRLQLEAQEQERMMAEQAVYLASINPMNELHVGAFGGSTITSPEPPSPPPTPPVSPLTILQYATDQGPSFSWDENGFSYDPELPPYSYTLDTDYIPSVQVPNPAAVIAVQIGNLATYIGPLAFNNCAMLASVTFASISVVTSIGSNAFSNCPQLTSIAIPTSVTSIAANAFASSGLTTVFISSATATGLGIASPATGVAFFGVTVDTFLPAP